MSKYDEDSDTDSVDYPEKPESGDEINTSRKDEDKTGDQDED